MKTKKISNFLCAKHEKTMSLVHQKFQKNFLVDLKKSLSKLILAIFLVLTLVSSVYAFNLMDMFTGNSRGTTDTSADSGRASTETGRTADQARTTDAAAARDASRTASASRTAITRNEPAGESAQPTASGNVPVSASKKVIPSKAQTIDQLKMDKETANEIMQLNEYVGSFFEDEIAGLYLGANLKQGKPHYYIKIETDMDFPMVYQFLGNKGKNTYARIGSLKLLFDNYDHAMETLKLLKESVEKAYITDKSGYDLYHISFTSNNCNNKYVLKPDDKAYDPKYSTEIQATFADCEVNMNPGSKDSILFGGLLNSWADTL